MNPTERFSNRAEDYRRYRPGYPHAVIDLMQQTCALKKGAPVADIGSGTGIFSKLLLQGGFEVTAVEPNAAMRKVAEEDLGVLPGFHSIAAAAEQTGLPGESFDAITVAQAFHWFDVQAARREFSRLLRPGGWVFLVWNHRSADTSPFLSDYEELLKTLGLPYESVMHRNEEARLRSVEEFFAGCQMQVTWFENPHMMDWPALRGRFLSASYAPAEGDPKHEEYVARLGDLFHKHAEKDRVVFDQQTMVYYGKLRENFP